MSKKVNYPFNKSLCKMDRMGLRKIYLGKGFDLANGYGFFCQIISSEWRVGNGFSKISKVRAVKNAKKDLLIALNK